MSGRIERRLEALEAEHRQSARGGILVLHKRDDMTAEEDAAWRAEHKAAMGRAELTIIIRDLLPRP